MVACAAANAQSALRAPEPFLASLYPPFVCLQDGSGYLVDIETHALKQVGSQG